MRQLAMMIAVMVVFSACTADTTEGDEGTTATAAATSDDTKVLRVVVSDDTSDWESGTSGLPA